MIWPLLFFSKVADYLAKYSKWFAVALAFILWVVDFIDTLVNFVIAQIVDAFVSIDVSQFSEISLSSIEYIGYANAILPLSEFIVLSTAYVTAWLTVILIRWVKSFFPTIAN